MAKQKRLREANPHPETVFEALKTTDAIVSFSLLQDVYNFINFGSGCALRNKEHSKGTPLVFPPLCPSWLGAGSAARLVPAFHGARFPFKCLCLRKHEGLSEMTFCAEMAAWVPPPAPGGPWQATAQWEQREIALDFNSSTQFKMCPDVLCT